MVLHHILSILIDELSYSLISPDRWWTRSGPSKERTLHRYIYTPKKPNLYTWCSLNYQLHDERDYECRKVIITVPAGYYVNWAEEPIRTRKIMYKRHHHVAEPTLTSVPGQVRLKFDDGETMLKTYEEIPTNENQPPFDLF